MRYILVEAAKPRPVLLNQEAPGYVLNSPIEGWIMTLVIGHATRFETKEEALRTAKKHYPGAPLSVETVED